MQKYSVNQQLLSTVLAWVESEQIAIPEIQRPFVWDSTKVRNLMESLYHGYPVGYLITWTNPSIRLKSGQLSHGKTILIDGQQRVTALATALLSRDVVDKEYRKKKIQIAFHPIEEKFEVFNPAIAKDPAWIPDIAPIIRRDQNILKLIRAYVQANPGTDEDKVSDVMQHLQSMTQQQIGVIDLSGELDIETVTEIFVRINSAGVVLSQADFAMSKIAANDKYQGSELRKCIDYFCHLAIMPSFYQQLSELDLQFTRGEYFPHLGWLKDENDDLYDPTYKDVLRVAFVSEFQRGKLADLVSLLSGRNFETREYEEAIEEETFNRLRLAVKRYVNETHFQRFVMIIKSTGFIDKAMITSGNAINFAYAVYLALRAQNLPADKIERFVRRWFVLSILTKRYSGSPESQMDFDIKRIAHPDFEKYLADTENAELSEGFWSAGLIQSLNTSVASSPYFNVYLAAQVKDKDKGFLSKAITVEALITHRGDIHHLFPRDFLKKHGKQRGEYNQIANYVYMQSETNIKIGNQEPCRYMADVIQQLSKLEDDSHGMVPRQELSANLAENCIPESFLDAALGDYESFLHERRKLMAAKIKRYYFEL